MTITLYTHGSGPNGWKVAILLEELGLQYDSKYLDFQKGEQKAAEHTKHNPNGRIPTIIDHDNGDFVLWESNAILKYIAETYDKEGKFHFKLGSKESFVTDQWLSFQASGQGPYFGQGAWFAHFHSEKIPSAIERYEKEIDRVISVLDGAVSKTPYLQGDKPTIADLSFVTWTEMIKWISGNTDVIDKYPNFKKWHESLMARPSVVKVYETKKKLAGH